MRLLFLRLLFSPLERELLKWLYTVKIAISKSAAYKANFALLMIAPIFVFFFIKYNLWSSIYHFNGREEIQGYSLRQMLQYQFWIMVFDLFVKAPFFSQSLSQDIRLGRISAFLLYPFGFLQYQASLFAADKIIQLFIGAAAFFAILAFGFVDSPGFSVFGKGLVFILMANIFWFVSHTLVGLLAFWLDETWSLSICIRFIAAFLSGSVVPLDLYPELLAKILLWTPFPYLAYFPVRLLMGESVNFGFGALVMAVWLALLFLLALRTWRRGLRRYTGSGI